MDNKRSSLMQKTNKLDSSKSSKNRQNTNVKNNSTPVKNTSRPVKNSNKHEDNYQKHKMEIASAFRRMKLDDMENDPPSNRAATRSIENASARKTELNEKPKTQEPTLEYHIFQFQSQLRHKKSSYHFYLEKLRLTDKLIETTQANEATCNLDVTYEMHKTFVYRNDHLRHKYKLHEAKRISGHKKQE